MIATLVALASFVFSSLALATSVIKIAKEYERGVVFRLGRLLPLRGPGLFFIFPFGIDRVRMVDLRVITLEVPQQEVITSDNVTVKVNAVVFFQVKSRLRQTGQRGSGGNRHSEQLLHCWSRSSP